MSKIVNFMKLTAIGGLLVIVPIAIVLFVLAQIFYGLYSLSESLLAEFGLQIDDALIIVAIAITVLVGLCFVTGLLVQTRLGVSIGNWFKNNVARRIPMYNAIASLTKRFIGLDSNDFSPVEVDLYGSSARALGFLIEQLPDGRCTVYIPNAPVATIGNIYVVDLGAIRILGASVTDTVSAISQWGVDTHLLYPTNSGDGVK